MKKLKLLNLKALIPQFGVPKPRRPATRLAARLTQAPYDDYEEEPTTKLSTAFLVVFVLHVVAVAGIYAFHSIKAKRREADGTAVAAAMARGNGAGPAAEAAAAKSPGAPVAPPVASSGVNPAAAAMAGAAVGAAVGVGAAQAKAAHLEKSQVAAPAPSGPSAVIAQPGAAVKSGMGPASALPPKAVAAAAPGAAKAQVLGAQGGEASSKTYKVVAGDNPVAIAKRLHVNYDDLLKVNGIDDPKKLRVGQVLKLPVGKTAGTH